MLYDPKWEKKIDTKADPFSLESLTAWLETMPANGEYNWGDCGYGTRGCLLMQYFRAKGFRNARGGASTVRYDWWFWQRKASIPETFIAISVRSPNTFGAARDRARSILSNNQRSGEQ